MQNPATLMVLALIFLLSGTVRAVSPFSMLYHYIVKPTGLIKSDYRLDNIQPHKFGQLVGVMTVAIAVAFIQFGYPMIGWGVIMVLIALIVVSYAGWYIGCFIYYQLNRLGLGGFFKYSPTDKSVFLGVRPGKMNLELLHMRALHSVMNATMLHCYFRLLTALHLLNGIKHIFWIKRFKQSACYWSGTEHIA